MKNLSLFAITFLLTTPNLVAQNNRAADGRYNMMDKTSSTQAVTSIKSVKKAQKILKEMNLYDGEINGLFNKKLTRSLRSFQAKEGLEVTGKLTKATLKELKGRYSPLLDNTENLYN